MSANDLPAMRQSVGLPTAADLDSILRVAEALSRADGMIPKQYVGAPAKILAAVLKGRELGIDAMASLNAFHVVEGKPVASSEFWGARIAQAGYRIEWVESSDQRATVRLTARDGRAPHTETWTWEMAQRAGLTGKQTWKGYPGSMLKARAIVCAGRAYAPEVMFGAALPDEVEEFRDADATVVRSSAVEQAQEAARGVAGLQARLGIAPAVPAAKEPVPATGEPAAPEPFDSPDHAIAAIAEADKGTLRAIMARVAVSGFAGEDAEMVKRAKDDRVAELQQVTA